MLSQNGTDNSQLRNTNQPMNSSILNGQNGGNSTENLFNLISAKKTKNTMILEPINKNNIMSPREEEIGQGLRHGDHSQDLKSNHSTDKSAQLLNKFVLKSPSGEAFDPKKQPLILKQRA